MSNEADSPDKTLSNSFYFSTIEEKYREPTNFKILQGSGERVVGSHTTSLMFFYSLLLRTTLQSDD